MGVTTPPSPPAGSAPTSATAQLAVVGMHCSSCAALIEETLVEQPGVVSAAVDLDAARAVVEYDPGRLGPDDLTATVAEAGYSATAVG